MFKICRSDSSSSISFFWDGNHPAFVLDGAWLLCQTRCWVWLLCRTQQLMGMGVGGGNHPAFMLDGAGLLCPTRCGFRLLCQSPQLKGRWNWDGEMNFFFGGWEPSSFCAGWRLAFVPDSLLGLAFVPDPTADGDGCGGWEPPSFYAGWRRAFVPDSLRVPAFVPEPAAEGRGKLVW